MPEKIIFDEIIYGELCCAFHNALAYARDGREGETGDQKESIVNAEARDSINRINKFTGRVICDSARSENAREKRGERTGIEEASKREGESGCFALFQA